jgi:hypothetical protein
VIRNIISLENPYLTIFYSGSESSFFNCIVKASRYLSSTNGDLRFRITNKKTDEKRNKYRSRIRYLHSIPALSVRKRGNPFAEEVFPPPTIKTLPSPKAGLLLLNPTM